MIAAAPREQAGNPEEMWDRIVREISASDRTFMSLVGRSSIGTSYEGGKLLVTVRPNKMRIAEGRQDEITLTAKKLYGDSVYVIFRSGDITKAGTAEGEAEMSEAETSQIIDGDINTNEVIEDIQDLFGLTPVVED
jgi:hypothetical protein